MITGIILTLLFGAAVLSGTVYWKTTDNELVVRAKRQIRYKNVKAREIEHVRRLDAIAAKRDSVRKTEEAEHSKQLEEERRKHKYSMHEWQTWFEDITREEDEARAKAEAEEIEKDRLAKLEEWKKDQAKRHEALIAETAERNRQNIEDRKLAEAANLNNVYKSDFGGQPVTYVKAIYARMNVRMEPTTASQVMFQITPYQRAPVLGWVYGEDYNGSNIWYKLAGTNGYVNGSGFEPANGVLPDLNEYEDSQTLQSFDGTAARTIKGRVNNPWDYNIQSVTRGGITAEKISAGMITTGKIYVTPQEAERSFERREQAIVKAFSEIAKQEPTIHVVDEMNSLADQVNALRKQKESYQVSRAHTEILKANEDALKVLDSIFA